MDEVSMSFKTFTNAFVAIVRFGPETPTGGLRPSEYYQVTIDPLMVSPNGEFIRFGQKPGDEITGWQRVSAMTVLENLGDWDGDNPPTMTIGADSVTFRTAD
jgi:hypothetical protein